MPDNAKNGEASVVNTVFYRFDREALRDMIEEEGYDIDDPEFEDIEDDVEALFAHDLGEAIGSALDELIRDKAGSEE